MRRKDIKKGIHALWPMAEVYWFDNISAWIVNVNGCEFRVKPKRGHWLVNVEGCGHYIQAWPNRGGIPLAMISAARHARDAAKDLLRTSGLALEEMDEIAKNPPPDWDAIWPSS